MFAPHSQWFSPEMPEWDMEKYRFYLDLPGDFWESGTLLRYLREREVQVSRTGGARRENKKKNFKKESFHMGKKK